MKLGRYVQLLVVLSRKPLQTPIRGLHSLWRAKYKLRTISSNSLFEKPMLGTHLLSRRPLSASILYTTWNRHGGLLYGAFAKLFPVNGSSVKRQNAFSIQESFKKMTKSLSGKFLPIAKHMDTYAITLFRTTRIHPIEATYLPLFMTKFRMYFESQRVHRYKDWTAKCKLKKSMGGVGRPKRCRTGKTTDGELGGGSNNST